MPEVFPQIAQLHHCLVVSCQAADDSPLNAPPLIAALARAAEMGGAAGFRIHSPENVAAVRAISQLPIIGIYKIHTPGCEVFITPTCDSAAWVVQAGANLLAVEATGLPRPNGETFRQIVEYAHSVLRVPVMADVGTIDQGLKALDDGADLVATTFSASPPYGKPENGPGLHIIRALARLTDRPLVVEGQVWTVENVRDCFEAGAYAVVIGSAITAPDLITRRFVKAIPQIPTPAG